MTKMSDEEFVRATEARVAIEVQDAARKLLEYGKPYRIERLGDFHNPAYFLFYLIGEYDVETEFVAFHEEDDAQEWLKGYGVPTEFFKPIALVGGWGKPKKLVEASRTAYFKIEDD